jgi:tyrosine-protein phosphatase SIW14
MASRFRSRQIALAVVLVALIGLSAGANQAGNQKAQPQHTIGIKTKARGIPNFGQVASNLYRGAQPSEEGLAALKKMGVEVVVDLRRGRNAKEESQVTKLGMKYVGIPTSCPYPGDQPYAAFLKVIRENPGRKIFVHCRLGDDRTGMAVAAYRMADEGWSAAEAMKEMQAFGFTVMHHVMCPGLAEYEGKFPERLKKSPAFRGMPAQDQPPTAR